MKRLVENEKIVKALRFTEKNFLEQPLKTKPQDLIFKNIFPYRFIPQTPEEKKSYLQFTLRGYKPVKNAYKSGFIYFYVFSHRDLFETGYEILRPDFIISELDNMFNSKQGIGLFKADFNELDDLYINDHFSGMQISYRISEWNTNAR